ncbi:ferritin [Pedobacter alpinus]|uniref:Ferritin n=1 Tax=Pedobacter alpinus TaxID=1590643 RepID=A0ABW5TV13_9SPHI
MKDLLRVKSLISTEIEALLNNQIKKEAHSCSQYLAMASWCDQNGFDNSADYFFTQSNEERTHQLKLFKYVLDMGGQAMSPDIENIKHEFNSFKEIFEQALEMEIAITQSFKKIFAACYKEQDFVTVEFLNWFLKEQREEEYKARRALELFTIIGEEATGLWEIDKVIPTISYNNEQV